MLSPSLPQYVSVDDAAAALSVNPQTIYRMIARGDLSAVKIGKRRPGAVRDSRHLRIPVSAIAEAIDEVR